MIKVSAPGKLCIAGEWAVLEKGNPMIAVAVEKRVFAKIKKSKDRHTYISIRDFKIKNLKALFVDKKLNFEKKLNKKEKKDTLFIKIAIESALSYLNEAGFLKIETWREKAILTKTKQIKKVGFGTSAASVVATTAGIFKFYGKNIKTKASKEKIYKLSTISHYLAQGKVGSGFDTAASTFGGLFVYKRFDPEWLKDQFEKEKSIKEIVDIKWPSFYFRRIKQPKDFNLLVGWTQKTSSTSKMVKDLYHWKEENKLEYEKIIKAIKNLVKKLIIAFQSNHKEKIINLIRKNEEYLKKLGNKSGVNIETKTLALLSKIANENGGAGKLSGAGGGDCGIAVIFDKGKIKKIKKEWKKDKIYFIETKLSKEGIREY